MCYSQKPEEDIYGRVGRYRPALLTTLRIRLVRLAMVDGLSLGGAVLVTLGGC